jgi:hypothetical protein
MDQSNMIEIHNIGGVVELAKILGVSPACVSNWRARHADFPKPLVELAMGPVYSISQVRYWAYEHALKIKR